MKQGPARNKEHVGNKGLLETRPRACIKQGPVRKKGLYKTRVCKKQ